MSLGLCSSPERWVRLLKAFGLSEHMDVYDKLVAAYGEAHRSYHTLQHIDACLHHLDAVAELADRPHEIEMALWFHDAIYNPFSGTNEQDSAKWAREFLKQGEIANDSIKRIYALIMVTRNHTNTSEVDTGLMLDIDLSILGAPPEIYDQFEKNIRKEYRRVPGFIFRKKRKEILQSFLDSTQIYNRPYFSDMLEAQAKENLSRTIAAL